MFRALDCILQVSHITFTCTPEKTREEPKKFGSMREYEALGEVAGLLTCRTERETMLLLFLWVNVDFITQ
jgi:hypothetical protein